MTPLLRSARLPEDFRWPAGSRVTSYGKPSTNEAREEYQIVDMSFNQVSTWCKLPKWARDGRRFSICLVTWLVSACGGHVGDSAPDFAERYAHAACECADPGPCIESEIVARLHEPDVNVECVEAYSDAMESRVSCNVVPMPTCAMTAADRYVRAVCACHAASGDKWDGCHDNVIGEVRGADPACLNAQAAGYESDCSGRSNPECAL